MNIVWWLHPGIHETERMCFNREGSPVAEHLAEQMSTSLADELEQESLTGEAYEEALV